MKSTARLIVSALLTLALSSIGTAGYAAAGNGQREHLGSSASHHHGRLEQDGSTRVLRALGRLDRKLVHATRASRLAPLTDADRDALQINAEADVAAVGAVADSYSATPDADSLAALERCRKCNYKKLCDESLAAPLSGSARIFCPNSHYIEACRQNRLAFS